MNSRKIIEWLLEGDVSEQYQVRRDLLGVDKKELKEIITNWVSENSFIDREKLVNASFE